ncbi:hypothetical protein [Dickeya phage Sucellus]|nr:hypothetical protein [Dickeya phage Sucellus]
MSAKDRFIFENGELKKFFSRLNKYITVAKIPSKIKTKKGAIDYYNHGYIPGTYRD